MIQKKRLKRGLDHLMGMGISAHDSKPVSERPNMEWQSLAINDIQPGKYQPRKDIPLDHLEDLARSIRAQGVLQPVIVRSLIDGGYELIAGERRWRASKLAGLDTIPAIIRNASDQETMAMALIENIQREDLNPIEEATALQLLAEDHGLTHQQLADAIGKSRASVTNLLRIMSLCPAVKAMISAGDLSLGHAKVLLTLDHPQQQQVAEQVVEQQLSVRETEALIESLNSHRSTSSAPKVFKKDPDVIVLENRLSGLLGVSVKVQHSAKGKGKLTIPYQNLKELEHILDQIDSSVSD